jgi:hypothetical protein
MSRPRDRPASAGCNAALFRSQWRCTRAVSRSACTLQPLNAMRRCSGVSRVKDFNLARCLARGSVSPPRLFQACARRREPPTHCSGRGVSCDCRDRHAGAGRGSRARCPSTPRSVATVLPDAYAPEQSATSFFRFVAQHLMRHPRPCREEFPVEPGILSAPWSDYAEDAVQDLKQAPIAGLAGFGTNISMVTRSARRCLMNTALSNGCA